MKKVKLVRMALLSGALFSGRSAIAQQYTVTDLGSLGGTATDAWAINASGQVVGGTFTETDRLRAFIWTDGTMQDLGSLPGGQYCQARAINDRGAVVGFCFVDNPRPFLWTADAGMVELPIPGSYAEAEGINSQGHVVGTFGAPDTTSHGFLYRDGVVEDLGFITASGLNDRDQVVGVGERGAWWDARSSVGEFDGSELSTGFNNGSGTTQEPADSKDSLGSCRSQDPRGPVFPRLDDAARR